MSLFGCGECQPRSAMVTSKFVHLHVGHLIRFDICQNWIRVTLLKDTCGNTIARKPSTSFRRSFVDPRSGTRHTIRHRQTIAAVSKSLIVDLLHRQPTDNLQSQQFNIEKLAFRGHRCSAKPAERPIIHLERQAFRYEIARRRHGRWIGQSIAAF